ncbi:TIM barrel protein [Terrimonas sp. NA20]|uniref:TIM barrel protein n=1 Tax=Terrimonas ginsenosidimutans TaxID=2908004 RepID=A0ABS9KLM6_9BACT|nr:TIM barrel protein [Terrimonas ginsenosidimutans]MCG2613228.1 TIM barrel protein [Terrimonas ginsenosidimutans]
MNTSTIQIANAPCSWGVLEFELEGKSMGYEQVLDEIAQTGYSGTELGDWGFMPTDPGSLRSEIESRRLELLGAFVPVALAYESAHDAGIEAALRTAGLMHAAGYSDAFIVLADNNGNIDFRTNNAGRIKQKHSLAEDSMKTFGRGAEKIASAVKDHYGMRTVFHHHCAGYIETPWEIEAFLSVTDPSLIGLCFDTGHFQFGGGKDPVEFMTKHWDRIWHVHFKDFSPEVAMIGAANNWDYFRSVKQGVFCELGKGVVSFKAIRDLLRDKKYKGWIVVEQDVLPGMGEPAKCAEQNRRYLKSIGL